MLIGDYMRRIICKHCHNMRDLGGYMTKSGKETKFNRFIRSDLPLILDEEEVIYLENNNIKTIIDLRSSFEVNKKPNFLANKDFKYYNISLISDSPKYETDIPINYIKKIMDKSSIYSVIKTMIEAKSNVLFHCAVGKDRTGVISMILLLVAGVYEEDIIADYQVSYTYLKEHIRLLHIKHPEWPDFIGQSKMEYMEKTLTMFKENFNDIDCYMKYLGFTKEEVSRLRSKLLD